MALGERKPYVLNIDSSARGSSLSSWFISPAAADEEKRRQGDRETRRQTDKEKARRQGEKGRRGDRETRTNARNKVLLVIILSLSPRLPVSLSPRLPVSLSPLSPCPHLR